MSLGSSRFLDSQHSSSRDGVAAVPVEVRVLLRSKQGVINDKDGSGGDSIKANHALEAVQLPPAANLWPM